MDLSSAYDTEWTGLLTEFIEAISNRELYRLRNNMISGRIFTVIACDRESRKSVLNNGLPQGSVLSPILFNLYTSDLPRTISRKFIYAGVMALAI